MVSHNLILNISTAIDANVTQSISWPWILVFPEFTNLTFLIIGVYTMYHGIEIYHPLYAILFVNLLIALSVTVVNISAFPFIHIEKYVMLSNSLNGFFSLLFHCNCWCICSIMRYLYIVHDSWMEKITTNIKLQFTGAIIVAFGSFFALVLPELVYAIHLGKVKCLVYCPIILHLGKIKLVNQLIESKLQ